MPLAIFDLDNTLIAGDSDHLWGQWLCDRGLVDARTYEQANERFLRDYEAGTLDIDAFLRFALEPLARYPIADLQAWRGEFVREVIDPIILPLGRDLIERHRSSCDRLMIITATNAFVTEPIAARLGIEHLLATRPAIEDGRYTGAVDGIPTFREGKVTRLEAWLGEHEASLDGSRFYSDSHNDLPLLQRVDHPVAVDPDERLSAHAKANGWPVISLRSAQNTLHPSTSKP